MSIELHCTQCQKLIRAPDNAGGRRGKCPYCGNSVYIPTTPDDSEEIRIAPIDKDAERREEELRRESIKYAAKLDHATDSGGAKGREKSAGRSGSAEDDTPDEVVEIGEEVKTYILAMRDSKLNEAEAVVARLSRIRARAHDHIQGMLLDELPTEYENVPPPVVQGFLKTLLGRFK